MKQFARVVMLSLAGAHLACAASEVRPFSIDDLVVLRRLSEPALSPDGRFVVYTLRETDLAANRGRTDLWLLDVTQPKAVPKRLTSHPENDGSAQWSRVSGHIYFLSSRSGTQQVWRLSLTGGEAQPVTRLPLPVTTFKLSPNDEHLAVTLDVFPDCPDLACTEKRLQEQAERSARGLVFDRVFVRHWDTWDNGTQTHLFVMQLKDGVAQGEIRDLSSPLDADVPSKPFGDASEYAFSPDGSTLVFGARLKGKSEPWSTNFDLYEVPVGGGTPKNLTADNPAWDTQPVFSPDGTWLAYRAMARPGFEADRFQVMLLNRRTGERRALAKDWDRSVEFIEFARDGRSLYALADHLGQRPIFHVDLRTGRVRALTDRGHVESLTVGTRALYFSRASFEGPADLYVMSSTGGKPRRLTGVNAEQLAATRLGIAEQFTFAGANGDTVYAHVVKPAVFDANEKYPVAFFVHGGPQVSYGNAWSYRWNPHVYAGAGYAFIAIDFHGSPGYGQAFTDSITQDWGGKPLEDLQKGLAAALAKYPWLDGSRMCALGASYGGFMMNWIAGMWPEPFRCIVNHAGIFDSRFMAYSTEELWFEEWEHGGPQYEVPQNYEKFNPVNHVKNWRTPMLVLAGQRDYRVPYSHSIATFNALQRRGIDSRLVIFPDENHWILKPANSQQWHDEVLRWLNRWTRQ